MQRPFFSPYKLTFTSSSQYLWLAIIQPRGKACLEWIQESDPLFYSVFVKGGEEMGQWLRERVEIIPLQSYS